MLVGSRSITYRLCLPRGIRLLEKAETRQQASLGVSASGSAATSSAEEIARERYARGEISRDEFMQFKSDLAEQRRASKNRSHARRSPRSRFSIRRQLASSGSSPRDLLEEPLGVLAPDLDLTPTTSTAAQAARDHVPVATTFRRSLSVVFGFLFAYFFVTNRPVVISRYTACCFVLRRGLLIHFRLLLLLRHLLCIDTRSKRPTQGVARRYVVWQRSSRRRALSSSTSNFGSRRNSLSHCLLARGPDRRVRRVQERLTALHWSGGASEKPSIATAIGENSRSASVNR